MADDVQSAETGKRSVESRGLKALLDEHSRATRKLREEEVNLHEELRKSCQLVTNLQGMQMETGKTPNKVHQQKAAILGEEWKSAERTDRKEQRIVELWTEINPKSAPKQLYALRSNHGCAEYLEFARYNIKSPLDKRF